MNYVVLGLAYGDEGKGTMVDYLCRHYGIGSVVRFSGGPQASHHVTTPEGKWHGFSQWSSGTLAGAKTFLNQHMIIEPYAMANEAKRLKEEFGEAPRLSIHPDCLVITPWHWKLNRLKEKQRGAARHGSCGMGVGETVEDNLTHGDGVRAYEIRDPKYSKLYGIRQRKIEEARKLAGDNGAEWLASDTAAEVYMDHHRIANEPYFNLSDKMPSENTIYEGSQGLLLDQAIGFAPYHTWSDLTPKNTTSQTKEIIGVIPGFWTRHGAGPFVTEEPELPNILHRHPLTFDAFNQTGEWQGSLRYGFFDLVALKYILRQVRIDCIALTKVDLIEWPMPICTKYTHSGAIIHELVETPPAETLFQCRPIYRLVHSLKELELMIGIPIKYTSAGVSHKDKLDLTENLKEKNQCASSS